MEKPTSYSIADIKQITHDTKQFSFLIPAEAEFSYLPGDYVKVFPDHGDIEEYRPYTPTSTPDVKGRFELIIKRYEKGPTSRFMHDRKTGDTVWISGPHEGGHFVEGMAKRVGMVAGGTGITPMISIIRWILKRGIDVSVSLIFANKTKEDIILRDEFDNYANEYPIFKRYYLLEKAPQGWTMGTGLVTSEVMREHLPAPSDETTIFLCGPAIMEIDLRKRLGELGYEKGKLIVP